MKRNQRYARYLRRRLAATTTDVLYDRLASTAGIDRAEFARGFYGAVRIVMRDGQEFCMLLRFHWNRHDPYRYCLAKMLIRVERYQRTRLL